MSTQHKHKHAVAKAILFLGVVLGGLSAYIVHFSKGVTVGPLTTKGPIAAEQANLIYLSVAIVLAVLVPTILVLYFFAWKYRVSNDKATYKPEVHHGKAFVTTMWLFPTLVMLLLAFILVPVTRRLDPRTPVNNGTAPMTIQVVALRWKWLFLYPEQQIATVNSVTIPKDRPVTFELTADETPMSSFWIPNLGGMLYAMTGHVNRLNLMASKTGVYTGRSAEINGAGFAGMSFTANVTSEQDFSKWVNQVQYKTNPLDDSAYTNLSQPSQDMPVTSYSTYAPDLYNNIVMKYMGDMNGMDMSNTTNEGQSK